MALVQPMIELLQQINSIEETPTSVEMCLQTSGGWQYCLIHHDPRLRYGYHAHNILEREEMMCSLARLQSGQIAVIAYFETEPNISGLDYVLVKKKVEGQHKLVLERRVPRT